MGFAIDVDGEDFAIELPISGYGLVVDVHGQVFGDICGLLHEVLDVVRDAFPDPEIAAVVEQAACLIGIIVAIGDQGCA